ISIVGFSGVGKTTTKNLIKNDEISLRHIPTISGDIATIKIGNLEFSLFDFAGQEQYKYLWKGFIKGSNAVLVITDSSPNNVEKSRYFIDLKEEEAPYAFIAVIGNKQDLPNAMKIENIEKILGLKTYPMIANRRENRGKMIGIIAELLGINIEESPLLSEIIGDEELIAGIKEARSKKAIELELENISVEAQEISIGKEKHYKPVNLLQDLSYEVEYDIKGLKTENTIKTHYNTISATLKNLNDNKEYSYEEFYKNFQDYRRNAFSCKNIMLKQFLEPNFFKLKNTIEEDESLAPLLKEEEDIILNALLCTYLTKSNPNKYSDFESISKRFKIKDLDTQTVNEINLYYLRILKKLSE
ncbi:MAG: ADP-ribosylation factor-like protein, partial [Promethearchaeota archaeon]